MYLLVTLELVVAGGAVEGREDAWVAGSAVRRREGEALVRVGVSVGVRGGLEEGRTGRSSSIICGVTAMDVGGDEEEGWPRMSERACSEL